MVFSLHEWEISQVEMCLGGVCQDEIVFTDAAFKLCLKVSSIISMAIVTNPHLSHPLDIILNHTTFWKRTVPNIFVLSSKTALTLQLEVELAIFHVVAHARTIWYARIWGNNILSLCIFFSVFSDLNLVNGDTFGDVRVLNVSERDTRLAVLSMGQN